MYQIVKAEKLAFLTDTEGVYMDKDDSSTVISEMTAWTVPDCQDG